MDYRYIRITDINEDGTLNDDWKTVAEVEKQYILKEGDVLFARSGATAGKLSIIKMNMERLYMQVISLGLDLMKVK